MRIRFFLLLTEKGSTVQQLGLVLLVFRILFAHPVCNNVSTSWTARFECLEIFSDIAKACPTPFCRSPVRETRSGNLRCAPD